MVLSHNSMTSWNNVVRACGVCGILVQFKDGWVAEWLACWTQAQKAWVQIAAATLSGNSLRQTVHTHRASIHQAAKLVAALLRVAGVTAGLAESNGSLPAGLWLTSPAGWLPRTGISSGTLRSVIEYGLPVPFSSISVVVMHWWRWIKNCTRLADVPIPPTAVKYRSA